MTLNLHARRAATVLVWTCVIAGAAVLATIRVKASLTAGQPDFGGFFLPAAQAVLAGDSPYSVPGYYYPPLLAVMLAPISHTPWVMAAWSVFRVLAACAAAFVAVLAFAPRATWLRRGVFTGIAMVTLLWSWPASLELWAGQPNFLVLLCLSLTALAVVRGRGILTGFALGMAAVVKGWPAGFVVWLLRRGTPSRARTWLGVGISAAFAVTLALLVGGAEAVADMVLSPFRGSNQQLLAADSVWGIGRMLFTRTPVGEPLVVSPILHLLVTATLALAMVGLLVLVLLRPGPDALSLFNTAFVIVLLLPVSHLFYLLIVIPVLWWWLIHASTARDQWLPWMVSAILVVWWIASFRVAPAGDGFMTTTWESLLRIFGTSFLACAASVLGAASLDQRDSRRGAKASATAVRRPRA